MYGGMKPQDEDMYQHAKMAHIMALKKKLHGMMADEPHPGEPGAADPHLPEAHTNSGLGEPVKSPPDLAMSPKHGMAEGSPEEEASESPEEESAEDHGHDDDELTAMKRSYFNPKPPERRPGTAIMIAVGSPKKGGKGKGKM